MIQKPVAPVEAASPEAAKKIGRPPKHGVAMTDAERKREQRRNEAIADVLTIPETHGRLHNERSGEADRKHGMSEMERIVAAQDRDENGRRVAPTGAAPTQMEQDSATDSETFDVKTAKADLRAQHMDEEKFRKYEETLTAVGEWLAETLPNGLRRCRLRDCRRLLNSAEDRERHVWQAYDRGHRQHEYIERLKDANAPQELIDEANGRLQNDWHFRVIMDRLKGRVL